MEFEQKDKHYEWQEIHKRGKFEIRLIKTMVSLREKYNDGYVYRVWCTSSINKKLKKLELENIVYTHSLSSYLFVTDNFESALETVNSIKKLLS